MAMIWTRVNSARMKCFNCNHTFGLTAFQLANDQVFKCPHCNHHNYGSTTTDKDGNLTGMKSVRTFEKIYK
jgi:DNA-directed RNA polymerase subunit RPC12/RpoP